MNFDEKKKCLQILICDCSLFSMTHTIIRWLPVSAFLCFVKCLTELDKIVHTYAIALQIAQKLVLRLQEKCYVKTVNVATALPIML